MSPHATGAAQAVAVVVAAASAQEHERRLAEALARDLLEAHENGDLYLDGWVAAREFVEHYHGALPESPC